MTKTSFFSGVYIDKDLYFSAKDYNGLFVLKEGFEKATFIDTFGKDLLNLPRHHFAFKHGNEIWFAPNDISNGLEIYNQNTNKIDCLNIPHQDVPCYIRPFQGCCIKGDEVWLIPNNYAYILLIDLNNREIKKIDMGLPLNIYNENCSVYVAATVIDEKVFLCPYNFDYISVIDLTTKRFKANVCSVPSKTYRNIVNDGKYIYVIGEYLDAPILKLDKNGCLVKKEEHNKKTKEMIKNAISLGNNIVCFPYESNFVTLIDKDSLRVSQIDYDIFMQLDKKSEKKIKRFMDARDIGGKLLIPSEDSAISSIIVDPKTNLISTMDIILEEDSFLKILISSCDK